MATTVTRPPAALDAIAAEIFDFLWPAEREPIPTAVDHAFERIWRQLVTGERRPGERLSDVELAAQLGVSRTPVRQALHRLAQDELVRFDPRRGFSVRVFSAQDVHEMYDVRAALEGLALRLAAPNLRSADLQAHLAQLQAVRTRLDDQPVVPFLQHDFQLHNFFIHASGNGRLMRLLAGLRSQVSVFQIRDTAFPWRMERALDGHERVLAALLASHPDQAADLLAAHIASSKENVLADLYDGRSTLPEPAPALG
jgi:DNA-binding GntR family transcriptional regulator